MADDEDVDDLQGISVQFVGLELLQGGQNCFCSADCFLSLGPLFQQSDDVRKLGLFYLKDLLWMARQGTLPDDPIFTVHFSNSQQLEVLLPLGFANDYPDLLSLPPPGQLHKTLLLLQQQMTELLPNILVGLIEIDVMELAAKGQARQLFSHNVDQFDFLLLFDNILSLVEFDDGETAVIAPEFSHLKGGSCCWKVDEVDIEGDMQKGGGVGFEPIGDQLTLPTAASALQQGHFVRLG